MKCKSTALPVKSLALSAGMSIHLEGGEGRETLEGCRERVRVVWNLSLSESDKFTSNLLFVFLPTLSASFHFWCQPCVKASFRLRGDRRSFEDFSESIPSLRATFTLRGEQRRDSLNCWKSAFESVRSRALFFVFFIFIFFLRTKAEIRRVWTG